LNYAHKNQNNFNAIFVPAQLNERIQLVSFNWRSFAQTLQLNVKHSECLHLSRTDKLTQAKLRVAKQIN
jgi:hypothetical protein